MGKKWIQFFKEGLWNFRLSDLKGKKQRGYRWLRIAVLSIRNFIQDKNTLRASALTFYTLMSIVPILAMMFAIAGGFGYQEHLRSELLVKFQDQKTALLEMFNFADKLLLQTHEGVIAGIGVIILFWTVTSLLVNLEEALNHIWNIPRHRSWRRVVSDYLAFILITPFFLILSSSMTVFVVSWLDQVVHKLPIASGAISALSFLVHLSPYALFWFFFTILYKFIPNTKVKTLSAWVGGFVAGSIFVIVQLGYVFFQVVLNRYGAVYGSFAALPLFLIWLQVSWFIFLFGAEVSYAHQTLQTQEFAPAVRDASPRYRKLIMLWIAQLAALRFQKHHQSISLDWIVHHCRIPSALASPLLSELVASGILTELKTDSFVPAMPAHEIRISDVLTALETRGATDFPFIQSQELEKIDRSLHAFSHLIEQSGANQLLIDIDHDLSL